LAKKEKATQMENQEINTEDQKVFRATLPKPEPRKLKEREKRESFRLFWARNKRKYGKAKDLENIIWIHLKAIKMDDPEKFEAGLSHFGLKKTK
jgi:hypothetical protein